MAEGVPVSRCGPLCQHPGCWHTSTHIGHGQQKDTEYTRFLSELLLRKKELKRLQARDGLHSSHTSDGLPTLKVQSINQKLLEGRGTRTNERRRSKTLPPLKISTRYKESPTKTSSVNYVQMQLQVDKEALDSDLCSKLLFSPVLLWRPGKRPHPSPVHTGIEISNRHRNEKTDPPNQNPRPPSSSPPHPQHTPPPATHVTASSEVGAGKERREIDAGLRRILTEKLTGKKNPLLVKTTNLTDALPPQESSQPANENKDVTTTPKHGKARHKLTSADAECFSYLGDIPPQVVAEILHQLRSESSSSINGTTFKPPHSSAHQNHTHIINKSQKAYSSTTHPRIPVPMASLPHSTYISTSSNNVHVPASLAYELSTHKILKPEPIRPRKRVSSFSRELSKHPLEVLHVRRRSSQLYSRQQVLEKIDVPKTVRDRDIEENFTRESELSAPQPVTVKRRSCQMHLPTAEIEPPTDLPAGVHPRYQPSSDDPTQGNPPTLQHTVETRPSQVQFDKSAMHMDDNNVNFVGPTATTTIEDAGGFQPRVPSTILLQLHPDSHEQYYETRPLSGRSRHSGHIMHTPRHQLAAPKNTVVVCPFSEEASPNHELETRGLLLKRRESGLQSRDRKSREGYRQQNVVTSEHEHPPLLPSVSPDYMLVGAHFADNNLVLVDKDGRIIHQLTDTEGESDVNIIAHLSELNVHTQISVDQQVIPQIESLNSDENQSEVEASKPGTGMKAPPPTAMEHSRDSGAGEDSEQGLVQVSESEEKGNTEAESRDACVVQETQPIVGYKEGEVERQTQSIAEHEEGEIDRRTQTIAEFEEGSVDQQSMPVAGRKENEIEIQTQLIAGHEEGEVDGQTQAITEGKVETQVLTEPQDEAQVALLTAKNEEDKGQTLIKAESEYGVQQALPVADHEKDQVPGIGSVQAGANGIPLLNNKHEDELHDRESGEVSRTDGELQETTSSTAMDVMEEENSKSGDGLQNGPSGADTAVEVPSSTIEQKGASIDCGNTNGEENTVDGTAPVITSSDSSC